VTGYFFFGLIFLFVFGSWLFHFVVDRRELNKCRWSGPVAHNVPITFLNAGMAIRPSILGHKVPEGYRHACQFFGVGLIDRTGTLDHGFEPQIVDSIPTDFSNVAPISDLCAQRATALVAEAQHLDRPIRLLWSGGIDSTCVAVALLNALGDDSQRLQVAFSKKSISEYRKFYLLLCKRGIDMRKIRKVSEGLEPDALIVTGEHGDQIFGSMLAANLDFKLLKSPWRTTIPQHIASKIGREQAKSMMTWLEPQLAACPIPLQSTYDFLWWANFSMKWQTVSHRVLATLETTEERNAVWPHLHHFFRTDDFQRWALANPDKKIHNDWPSYKYPLKDIIFEFNSDKNYHKQKIKERSLRELTGRLARRAIAIDATGQMYAEPIDRSILPARKRWSFNISRDWE